MSKNTKEFIQVWIVHSALLFIVCAFAEFTIKIDEWSIITRAIFGVGVVGLGIMNAFQSFD